MIGQNPKKRNQFHDLSEVEQFTREYLNSEFPNPDREDCPPSVEILGVLRANKPPSEALLNHLFGCSECFRDYREAFAIQRSPLAKPQVSLLHRFQKLFVQREFLAFASIILVIVLSSLTLKLVWNPEVNEPPDKTPSLAANTGPSSTPPPSTPEVPPTQVGTTTNASDLRVSKRSLSGNSTRLIARAQVTVDLEKLSVIRGAAENPNVERPLRLYPSLITVFVKLREGSPAGKYHLAIVDAYGKSALETIAESETGKALTKELNLRTLEKQHYRLCVWRIDEIPDCYPIVVR